MRRALGLCAFLRLESLLGRTDLHSSNCESMTNPYSSPTNLQQEVGTQPTWYVWFYKAYQPVWWIGTALVVASWLNVVTPTIGWIGFALAGTAALGSYVLTSIAGIKQQDYVILNSRLVKNKDDAYYNAMERFRNGATLMYDGVAFGFRPNNEVACGVVAGTVTLTESFAMELAEHAQSVFVQLQAECKEFASAVADHTFRVSIMSGQDAYSRELCRVVDGNLQWPH